MPQFENDRLTDEESIGSYTLGEPDDESFQLESLEQYPGELPGFEFDDTPLIEADIPELEVVEEMTEADEGDTVWDSFGDDKTVDNENEEIESISNEDLEVDDIDSALAELDEIDFLDDEEEVEGAFEDDEIESVESNLNDNFIEDSEDNVNIDDDEIEQLTPEEIAALEGKPFDTSTDFENNEIEDFSAPEKIEREEEIDLDSDAAELKAMLQKELNEKSKNKNEEEPEELSDVEDFDDFDNEDDAEVISFDKLNIDKPSNFQQENSDDSKNNQDDSNSDNDEKTNKKKKRKRKKNKLLIYITAAASVIILAGLGYLFILPMFEDNGEVEFTNTSNAKSNFEIIDDLSADDATVKKDRKKTNYDSDDESVSKNSSKNNNANSNKVSVKKTNKNESGNGENDNNSNSVEDDETDNNNSINSSKDVAKNTEPDNNKKQNSQSNNTVKNSSQSKDNSISNNTKDRKDKNNNIKSGKSIKDKAVNKKQETNDNLQNEKDVNKKIDLGTNKSVAQKKKQKKNRNRKKIKSNKTKQNKDIASKEIPKRVRNKNKNKTSSKKKDIAEDSNKGIFTIQIYASPSRQDALEWLGKLKKHNISDGFISEQIVRDEIWYRVRFGKYTTKQQARETAMRYGFTQTWIDRIR